MSTVQASPRLMHVSDLLKALGDVPIKRIRFEPYPGTATLQDVQELREKKNTLCELIDGILLEKAMGYNEANLAIALGMFLQAFVAPRNLGLVTGPDGIMELAEGLVRIPDLAFVSWDRLPGRQRPTEPIPRLAPNLAIEILSRSNTPGEMTAKRHDYFNAGVELVWEVDPEARTVTVHTSEADHTILDVNATLDGGEVLSGFTLPLRDLFAELDRRG